MIKKARTRQERDSLGNIKVPVNSMYGAFTARAKNNFQISGQTAPKLFIHALGIVKKAAAKANTKLGLLSKSQGRAIETASQEFIEQKFSKHFILDIFQAGAGTSYNMNANEIIATRSNQLLKNGSKLHPNNHINLGQSSNDVIPTATRIAILLALPELQKALQNLDKTLSSFIQKHKKTIKVARTHLQDAVPITFGQEFDSYKQALLNSTRFVKREAEELKTLGIGGTAVGTGINSHKKYKETIIKELKNITKINFKAAKNATEIANNHSALLAFSATLRSLSTNLLNISSDIKLMSMGPITGLNELILPPVQPGSSIMPGKVNPSILECLEMICMDVLGNDRTIELATQRSQFELNTNCPLIMQKILCSMEILTNGINMLNNKCLKGLKVNKKHVEKLFKQSLSTATALVPALGYDLTAKVVKDAQKKQVSIEKEVLQQKLLKKKDLSKLLSPSRITGPNRD